MPIPKHYEMHKPLLGFLESGKPLSYAELKLQMIQHFGLSDDALAELLPSGRQTVDFNVAAGAGMQSHAKMFRGPYNASVKKLIFRM